MMNCQLTFNLISYTHVERPWHPLLTEKSSWKASIADLHTHGPGSDSHPNEG